MTKTDTRDERVHYPPDMAEAAAAISQGRGPLRESAKSARDQTKRRIRSAPYSFNTACADRLEQSGRLRLIPATSRSLVPKMIKAASERKIPIRIGVNAGSLEKDLLKKYDGPTADGMVESALRHIGILEDLGYTEIKVSLKASDPLMMIEAYRILADKVDYPLHLGVTEAGTPTMGTISLPWAGHARAEGIGDTIRVSFPPSRVELRVGIEISTLACQGG